MEKTRKQRSSKQNANINDLEMCRTLLNFKFIKLLTKTYLRFYLKRCFSLINGETSNLFIINLLY